jgi:hypothetical protein
MECQHCKKFIQCYHSLKWGKEIESRLDFGKTPTHQKERMFVELYFNHKNWLYLPMVFHLPIGNYTPDFYDAERHVFLEVAGSRQAFHANKHKYQMFKELLPSFRLEVVDHFGSPIGPILSGNRISWV